MDKLKYSSPYPSEVVYRSDKNFIVRLKAMIDLNMKSAGYSTGSEQFKDLIESFDSAEEYLFDESPDPATPSAEVYRKALEKAVVYLEGAYMHEEAKEIAEVLSHSSQPEQVKEEPLGDVSILINGLNEIIKPIDFMRKRLQEGEQLNGVYAIQLSNDPAFLKDIAANSLSAYKSSIKRMGAEQI